MIDSLYHDISVRGHLTSAFRYIQRLGEDIFIVYLLSLSVLIQHTTISSLCFPFIFIFALDTHDYNDNDEKNTANDSKDQA